MSSQPSISTAGPSNPPSASTASTSLSARSKQASSRLYDVASLENDGSNFQTWKYRITTVLDIRGLWEIVDGTEKKPDPSKVAELEEWTAKDKEARAQITLTLKDEPLSGVLLATSAEEIWRKLSERYEGKGKQSIAYLIGELFRGTLSDESPMETQLNAMRQKAYVLKSLGQPLDDSLVAVAMVISLPATYSTLRTILMSTSDKLSIDTVIAQVLVEEKSRQTSNGQSALVAKGPNKSKNKDSKSKDPKSKKTNQKKCSYCKRTGHDEKECWKRKAEEADKSKAAGEKEKPKEKTDLSAKVAHMSSDQESPLQLFVARETQKGVHTSNWIVDSGASANMTCQRETFITFRPLSPPE